MNSLLRTSILLAGLLSPLSAAEEKPSASNAIPLETRVLEAEPGAELREPNAPPPGLPSDDASVRVVPVHRQLKIAEAIPLPPTADGEPRYDLLPFLKAGGLEAGEGSEAIWLPESGKLVLTMSVKDQDIAERMVDTPLFERGLASIQLVFSVWEYQDDAAKPQEPPLTGASLRERPGLRLVHSQTIHTRSGNRVTSIGRLVGPESRADQTPKTTPTPERAGAAKSTLGENRGSVLEVEPVIGPDGISIDFQMDYEIHIPSAEPRRDLELKGTTNLTVISGKEVMVQSGFLDQGARARQRRPYALVVKGEVLREQGQHREAAAAQLDRERRERNKAIIQRAKEGLPEKKGSPASPR